MSGFDCGSAISREELLPKVPGTQERYKGNPIAICQMLQGRIARCPHFRELIPIERIRSHS